ncbi:MAG TPA: tripartite tricarboxylate transporter TctB family protein [Anaeromyxobacter sp.]|nr:tripartite tricarboxylate transporter TctB family protein [Anaeromyxobacter sp.]
MDVETPAVPSPAAPEQGARLARRGPVRSPRDLVAGAILVALAAFALATGAPLEGGTLRAMGPGMLPRAVAAAVGVAGLLLVGFSFARFGLRLGRWPIRGPIFVTLAVVAFALTIRSVGLVLAGPLVVVVSGAASSDVRWKELVAFAVVMTAFCVVLFRSILGLPIPILSVGGFTW